MKDHTSSNPIDEKVQIIEFTDPVCNWCWAVEPTLRKLEVAFAQQIELRFVMGGLVPDITTFMDPGHGIGGDPDEANQAIAAHWLEASQQHRMPIKADGFALFSHEHPSSYPQNIAVKAVALDDTVLAKKFLRRIREATMSEAAKTNQPQVLIQLAKEVGVNLDAYTKRLADGSAEKAFGYDRAILQSYEISTFPSFLVQYQDKETVLHGYQSFESIVAVMQMMTDYSLQETEFVPTAANLVNLIRGYGRMTATEIMVISGLQEPEIDVLLEAAKNGQGMGYTDHSIQKMAYGNGYFYELTPQPCHIT